jgi:hypothetical protein
MEIIKLANLALSFLLELCALAALGYWGYHTGQSTPAKLGLAIGAPLLMAVFWGAFLAPKAAVPLAEPLKLALKLVVFGLAVAALAAAGPRTLAGIFAVAVIVNLGLAAIWRQ